MSDPIGFAVVDKATEWTSHDVVAKARGVLGTRKVGHSGTLDPGATGVLVLGVGRATKLLRFVTGMPKTYVAEVLLGVETDSLDADGDVTIRHDMSHVTIEDIRGVLDGFRGPIEQIPPMVSAIKVDGKRLHQLAREGKEVERKPRAVTIHRLDVPGELVDGVFTMEVECSAGTYIRTLGADIGTVLGGGASLVSLRRTAVGSFVESMAKPVDELDIIDIATGLAALDQVIVDDEQATLVGYGRPIHDEQAAGEGPWMVMHNGAPIAVHERIDDRIKVAWVAVSD